MEARFGIDFSRVRIHDDGRAAATAADLDAAAFTTGRAFSVSATRPARRKSAVASSISPAASRSKAADGVSQA